MYIACEKELNDIYTIKDIGQGKGVFAVKDIPEKTILMRVKGDTMNFAATKLLGEKEDYTLQIGRDTYVLTKPPFCFVNHCCQPNSALDEDLFLYTIKPIKAGEQVCWDYSTSMLERSWTMNCHCGSPDCRGLIDDFDRLPQEVRQKYISEGLVLPFILRQLKKVV
jgi:hypothetical protein